MKPDKTKEASKMKRFYKLLAIAILFAAVAGLSMGGCDTGTNPGSGVESEYDADGYHKVTGFNKEGYNRAGFDANGFNKAGFDKDGYDKNGFDASGFNKAGFDKNGYDKDGYDASGYNKDGYDKNGQKQPNGGSDPEVIPSYTRHSYNTVKDISFDMGGNLLLESLPQYTNNNDGNNLQSAIVMKWYDLLCEMQVQGDNLKNGYSAVAEAYPDLTGIDGIIANENGIHGKIDNTNDIGTYLSGADANINAMLNGILGSGDRTQFNKNLAAYKLGHYANQKVLDGKAAAQAEYTDALAATGLADLPALESAILNAINGAMGVNDIKKASHRGVVSGLNSDLIKQIQDLSQAKALANDLSGLNYINALGGTFSQVQVLGNGNPNPYNESRDAQTVQPVALLKKSSVFSADVLKNPYIREENDEIAMA
jgi:hypothetical protein